MSWEEAKTSARDRRKWKSAVEALLVFSSKSQIGLSQSKSNLLVILKKIDSYTSFGLSIIALQILQRNFKEK